MTSLIATKGTQEKDEGNLTSLCLQNVVCDRHQLMKGGYES